MKSKLKPIVASSIAALVVTLVGVLFFFKPLTDGDVSFVTVHPVVGLVVYLSLCMWLFVWATDQTGSTYKGAFIVAAPQFIFILDLMFRGNRGFVTTLAGTTLLVLTWLIVAYIYSRLESSKTK